MSSTTSPTALCLLSQRQIGRCDYGDERKRHGIHSTRRVSRDVGSALPAEPESIRVGTREWPQAYGAMPPPKAPTPKSSRVTTKDPKVYSKDPKKHERVPVPVIRAAAPRAGISLRKWPQCCGVSSHSTKASWTHASVSACALQVVCEHAGADGGSAARVSTRFTWPSVEYLGLRVFHDFCFLSRLDTIQFTHNHEHATG